MKAENIYPITTITYPSGDAQDCYISEHHMAEYTPPVRYREFLEWMRGQTRHANGFYISDVDKWLRNKSREKEESHA